MPEVRRDTEICLSSMNNPVSIPATISKVTTMADHTLRLQVDTQEIAPELKSQLFGLHEKLGYFFFAEEAIRRIDKTKLPEIIVDETERKTPSQRLRDRMYVYFTQALKKEGKDFEPWYRRELERIGEKYLEKVS